MSESSKPETKKSLIKKAIGPALCAGLALSAVEAVASSLSPWDLNEHAHRQRSNVGSDEGRLDAIAENLVAGPKVSQNLGHAWYNLAERMEVDGKSLLQIYQEEGLGEFLLAQSGSAGVGSCYVACYGNCYGNCYSNCYSNCHSADS